MGSGLVIAGKTVTVPGLDVTNWLDDPDLRLDPGDFRPRYTSEAWVHLIVLHTTRGIPGGDDQRPQVVLPGLHDGHTAEQVVRTWTLEERNAGAHLVVQQDGKVACCADLKKDAAYHAGYANGCSIGIEIVQGPGPELYQGQLDAAVRLVDGLTRIFGIQRQIPDRYLGPIQRFTRADGLEDVVGVVGHRDLTGRRGAGDPGCAIMNLLGMAGYEPINFAFPDQNDGDKYLWRRRQREIGMANADGIPGPVTVKALANSGRPWGMWVPRPGDTAELTV